MFHQNFIARFKAHPLGFKILNPKVTLKVQKTIRVKGVQMRSNELMMLLKKRIS
jgi:hypothetical protein